MRRLVLTWLTLAALLWPCGASAKTVSAFGIKLQRCAIVENAQHTQTTGVNVIYYNTHQTPATDVYFFVSYHGANYTLIDRGTFTHGAVINHTLTNALAGVVWQGGTPRLCTPSRVRFATGKVLE